ncbi:MAG: copper chaperone PCu(A)C [Pseudomonadota bacterium]
MQGRTIIFALVLALTAALSTTGGVAQKKVGSARAGDISVSEAWIRGVLPVARVASGYLTVTNRGSVPDTLIGVRAPFAQLGQIHTMSVTDGVMIMSALDGGITIGPGETVTLSPGGLHLMFMDLTEAPPVGSTQPVVLEFARAGDLRVDMPVSKIGAISVD